MQMYPAALGQTERAVFYAAAEIGRAGSEKESGVRYWKIIPSGKKKKKIVATFL